MESHVATFVVEGAFLTETARDLMLSERPAAAWRLLAENLLGGEPGQGARFELRLPLAPA